MQDKRVAGSMQLFSIERQQAQFIEGHAADFVDFASEAGGAKNNLFAIASRTASGATVRVIRAWHRWLTR